jgi:hypothetical protein
MDCRDAAHGVKEDVDGERNHELREERRHGGVVGE